MSVLLFALTLSMAQTPATAGPAESFLRQYAQTRRFESGLPASARVTDDGKAVLFLRSPVGSFVQTLYVFDVATAETRELLTPEQLLKGAGETLSVAERARLERQRVSARGFTAFALSPDGRGVLVTLS